MIPVVYPQGMNWFYEAQAHRLVVELRRVGIAASTLPSNRIGQYADDKDCVLVISLAEILAEPLVSSDLLRTKLSAFRSRVLVNLDCLHTPWFTKSMAFGFNFFTDLFDVGQIAQSGTDHLVGMRYHWIPEALTGYERETLIHRTGPRSIPWALIAHVSKERSALIAAAVQNLPSNGFVFAPPLRLFRSGSGLDERSLARVLEKTDFYIWGSHHRFRYHEGLRALQSVQYGAVPVKIDPLHADAIDLPWVYPSLSAFKRSQAYADPDAALNAARDRILANGTLGERVAEALHRANVRPTRS